MVATDFVYRVQAGDTLQAIAAAYYGDAAYAWSLYNANSDVLGGASTLTPGTLLALP